MKTTITSALISSILVEAGLKGLTDKQLEAVQSVINTRATVAVDKMDPRVIKRVFIAKGAGIRETAKALHIDTLDVTISLGPRQELNDKPKTYWAAKTLKTSEYASITYSDEEIEAIEAMFNGVKLAPAYKEALKGALAEVA